MLDRDVRALDHLEGELRDLIARMVRAPEHGQLSLVEVYWQCLGLLKNVRPDLAVSVNDNLVDAFGASARTATLPLTLP